MNGVDFPVTRVLDGIDAAVEAGFAPIKINVVLRRGENEDADRRRWRAGRATPATSSGSSSTWTSGRRTAGASTRSFRRRRSSTESRGEWPLEPATAGYRGEVAERWRYVDGRGEIGVIASVTKPFCGDCTRARLSAEGKLYTCLFSAVGHDLREPLRSGDSDDDLAELITTIWAGRDDRYSERRAAATEHLPKIEMFALGG